jgi:hypothetical protein
MRRSIVVCKRSSSYHKDASRSLFLVDMEFHRRIGDLKGARLVEVGWWSLEILSERDTIRNKV